MSIRDAIAWIRDEVNPEGRQRARGKGGLRRTDWDTVLEIIAASMVQTIKKHGPDRRFLAGSDDQLRIRRPVDAVNRRNLVVVL